MAHKRKSIRDALVTRLTGLATTGINVHVGGYDPLTGDQLPPALVIRTFPDVPAFDEGEGAEIGPRAIPLRSLEVTVEGYFSGGSDDDLDQIAVEVEEAIYTDPTFGALAAWTVLGAQDVGRDSEGRRREGMITMDFVIVYSAPEGAPQG